MKSLAVLLALALLAVPAAAEALKPWPGGATPALELSDLEGARHRLADYRGKVVLVNFWATWCEPCREEMPSIERLRASLEGRPFAVLAVNLAEPESRIRKFLDTVPGRYTVLLDRDGQAARAWQARMLPATYIVGLDGRIRYRHVGDMDWARAEVRDLVQGLMK
jgi:thiol-disulfide isomerase/thioredoxin